ncbi:SUF system Fe-S cluster assembly protein [Salinibacter sp. 10B]|uniref:SUF system Fe-S cluster assembly protein n=1 Tax=Salinibacter sp. 10B TaxID=1923971 RepID=UPI000CF3A241|nr:SUF system Fe-S cluster assembly protein [Salinibacter sp. 10B]
MNPAGAMGGMPPGGGGGGAADIPDDKENTDIELPETIPDHVQETPENELYERVVASLREIYDPEIPVNIYDLGLIYHIEIDEDNHVDVLMTLTAPNCPAAGILPGQAEDAVRETEGVESVNLEMTFEPPFSPEMMSEEARLELGFM